MSTINTNLNVAQSKMVELNKGKQVEVYLSTETINLYIHGGDNILDGEFRYIMHKAKNPRKIYDGELSINENINRGYYFVQPFKIIL